MNESKKLPSQLNKIKTQLMTLIKSNPLDEKLVLVGKKQSYLDKIYKYSYYSINSGLISCYKINTFMKNVKGTSSIFSELGKPNLYSKIGDKTDYYEVANRFQHKGINIEAFVIEKEDPTLHLVFEPRQDFTLFYSLFDEIEDSNRKWDDHLRAISDVIKFERNETTSQIRINKDYLLDYLFIRNKALLIASYIFLVFPAKAGIPDDFNNEFSFNSKKYNAKLVFSKNNIDGEKLTARLNLIRVIYPPTNRKLGNFGAMVEVPNITFETTVGSVNMRKFISSNDLKEFLSKVYFKSEVLRQYETDSRYRIDDHGGVHYRGVWGIFRGIRRLGDEILVVNLGDLTEGLPYEEWKHWEVHNINPLSAKEHIIFAKIKPINKLLNELLLAIKTINSNQSNLIMPSLVDDYGSIYKNVDKFEDQFSPLKKVFTKTTSKAEFLLRTVDLYKILVDNLNKKLLGRIVDSYDDKFKFDDQDQVLGSLKLFLTYFKLQRIEKMCKEFGLTANLKSKTVEYYTLLLENNLEKDDALFCDIKDEISKIEENFSPLFTLYAFRSKSGGAHSNSQNEFDKAVTSLGFKKTQTNFLLVYRSLINKITNFFETV